MSGQNVGGLLRCLFLDCCDSLLRVPRAVRRTDYIGHMQQGAVLWQRLLLVNIQAGTGKLSRLQCLHQRLLPDHRAPGCIHKDGCGLHAPEGL